MKTKDLTMAAVLLALGSVLHYLVPGFFNGIKPDFLLATMFIAIALNKEFKGAVTISFAAGLIASATTNFPGGQIPSIIDKLVSGLVFYLAYHHLCKVLNNRIEVIGFLFFIHTIISGLVFLVSASIFAGLPAGLGSLLIGIVVPTAFMNIAFGLLIYKIFFFEVKKIKRA